MVLPPLFREGSFSLEGLDRAFFPALSLTPFYLLNIVYLIPLFLKRGKYFFYILSIIASYVVFLFVMRMVFEFLIDSALLPRPGLNNRPLPEGLPLRDFPRYPGFGGGFFTLHFILMTVLGLCFELIMEWEKQKRKYQESQKEKVSTELSFLKSQINPHFFFNTLNNIYALAAAKSDDTEKAILLLSNMMRYVLYEAGTEKILLSKEVQFIENYIALQKIRFSVKKAIDISFETSGATDFSQIAPMLFLPMVENAFKHGISYREKSFVAITLVASEQDILFTVKNSKARSAAEMLPSAESKNSGIGLENIKKRLNLLYPKKHKFVISECEKEYMVKLQLCLHD